MARTRRLACWAAPLALLGVFGLPGTASAATCTVSAGPDWNTPATWTCDDMTSHVPTADDDVVIPTSKIATLSTGNNGIANSITLQSGGTLTVGGGKALTSDGGAASSFAGTLEVLDAGTLLFLAGNTTWSGGGWSIGGTRFTGPNGGEVRNTGTLTISGDVTASNPGGGLMSNLSGATLQRTTSEGTATLLPGLENDGQVTVDTGTLNLGGGAGTSLGDYTVAAGKTLGFTGGTHTVAGGATDGSITGAGTVLLGGASLFLEGAATYNVAGETMLSSGRLDLAASVTGATGRLTSDGVGFGTRSGAGTLNVGAGVSIIDKLTFAGKGTTNYAPGATINAAGTDTTLEVLDEGTVVHLDGTTTWSSGRWSVGGTRFGGPNGGKVENAGTLTISGDVTADNSGSGLMSNLSGATLQRTTSEGTATLTPGLDNDGQLTVNTGTLNLGGGAGTSLGDYTVAADKTLGFTGGTHTVAGSAGEGSISGGGTVRVGGANVFVEGAATYNVPGETMLSGGRLDLAASVTGATGRLTSDGANFAFGARTGQGTLNVGAGTSNLDRITFGGGGTTNYAPGATIDATTGGSATTLEVIDAGTVVHLNGSTTWSAGGWSIGGTRFTGPNGGTVENAGTLTVSGDVTANNSGGGQVHNLAGGTLQRTTSAAIATLNPPVDNDGQLLVATGTLQTSAGTASSGSIDIADGAVLDAGLNQVLLEAGGSLGGASDATAPHPTVEGTLNNQAGTVQPGGSPGIVAVEGTYTQGSGGTLETEIAGTTPGTQFDQLIVSGNATLDGTLAIVNDPGFDPASSDTFEIVQTGPSGRSGTFSSVTGAQLSGKSYTVNYNPDDVTLTIAVDPPVNTSPPSIPSSGRSGDRITCNLGTWTGGPSFTIEWLRDGVPIPGATGLTYVLTPEDVGHVITCRVTGTNSAGSAQAISNPLTPTAPGGPSPPAAQPLIVGGCLNASASVRGKRLGPARLGRGRQAQRAIFRGANLRTRRDLDRYCAVGGGTFRIGYPTARLNRTLGRSLRRRVSERVVLVLTSSPRFTLRGIKRGTSEAVGRRRLGRARRVRVGRNVWYVAQRGAIVQLLKTQRGVVREIGIGDGRLTRGLVNTKRFLRTWEIG